MPEACGRWTARVARVYGAFNGPSELAAIQCVAFGMDALSVVRYDFGYIAKEQEKWINTLSP